jgi:hypothetical protein
MSASAASTCGLLRGRVHRGKWQGHPKHAAAAEFALDGDAPFHRLHDIARDRQPQSGPGMPPRRAGVELHVGLKDRIELRGGNAGATVLHLDQQSLCGCRPEPNADTTHLGELERIADQGHEHLPEARRVAQPAESKARLGLDPQRQAALIRQRSQRVADDVRLAQDIEGAQIERNTASAPAEIENVVDQSAQTLAGALLDLQQLALRRAQAVGAKQQLGGAEHSVQGCAYLVAGVGDQARPRLRGLPGIAQGFLEAARLSIDHGIALAQRRFQLGVGTGEVATGLTGFVHCRLRAPDQHQQGALDGLGFLPCFSGSRPTPPPEMSPISTRDRVSASDSSGCARRAASTRTLCAATAAAPGHSTGRRPPHPTAAPAARGRTPTPAR